MVVNPTVPRPKPQKSRPCASSMNCGNCITGVGSCRSWEAGLRAAEEAQAARAEMLAKMPRGLAAHPPVVVGAPLSCPAIVENHGTDPMPPHPVKAMPTSSSATRSYGREHYCRKLIQRRSLTPLRSHQARHRGRDSGRR